MERNVTLIALFAALIAALGLIPPIALGFGVPITAQSLGVMLCGTVLGARRGALAVLLFLLLVAIGLPLLAGGRGGFGVFAGPTAGFLVGFPIGAFIIGLIVEKMRAGNLAVVAGLAAMIGGIVVVYAFGIAGFAFVTGKGLAASATIMAPFVPGDIVKAVIAGLLTQALFRARPASVLSRS
ncbi:biotin transporter BioY (plasmid) [Aliiroseovarius crassostreae]|uniref:biotin transporter BioY n=1 Tax=Aliiroseovarius crassostreae TaxID=154981 RepID=UPI0021FF2CBA|nr:biotin transporter BioY [Aliiroseovarius crassostreae]UWQ09793.1 biotin transporter BioY [Aliiroseovarius crassostreae]UWQ12864.1 biotin transporter BioY [Aliiroseovarius crassostreae]